MPPTIRRATFQAMYVVTEADAAAIREVYERDGELSAAIELRRRFPGITDNARAREQARGSSPGGNRCHHDQHGGHARGKAAP